MSNLQTAAIEVAKEERDRQKDDIVTLSSGVRVKLLPVNPATIAGVIARIEDPKVPMWHNPQKGRDEPNPLDPSYERALVLADQQRGVATMDALALIGVELVDGLPEDDAWLKKLKLLDKVGHLDLSAFDLEDEIDVKYLYCKNVAIGSDDWPMLFARLAISEEGVETASKFFQSGEVGDTD
jgi:hypothetical protein